MRILMQRVLLFLVLTLAFPASAMAGLAAPTPRYPDDGASFTAVPAFGWSGVSGADHYALQVAADAKFDSPVGTGGDGAIDTRNTWATMKKSLPNGKYWWRVRAVTKTGGVGPWSFGSAFRVAWVGQATPVSPVNGATISYPDNVTIKWNPVAGAAKYVLLVASDADLSSFDGEPVKPVETDTSSYTILTSLSPGQQYYWSVTPVDAEGNRGVASTVVSFTWLWPSVTVPHWHDLAPSADVVDPQFSWDPIPGAVRYEVEINSDQSFASGSKFCCSKPTVATVLSPKTVLLNNRYYWRVRGIDADGHNGEWNDWVDVDPFFRKTFDTRDPGDLLPSIANLRMSDNTSDAGQPGTDLNGIAPGYQTSVPIVTWDPVLGASAYEVEVRGYNGVSCVASLPYWDVMVATNAWTPLGPTPADNPLGASRDIAHENPQLALGKYCVRVRAYTDDGLDETGTKQAVHGDWTYLSDPANPFPNTGASVVSFEFVGYPDDPCVGPACHPALPTPSDYHLPLEGTTTTRNPYFTWAPIAGSKSYYVVVSLDANFTSIVDYALTREPAYAPRASNSSMSYADETTFYYWAVLPAATPSGGSPVIDPLTASARSFQKESVPPTPIAPVGVTKPFAGKPTFQWSLAEGARVYDLQVATDPKFSPADIVDDITTASTSYTPDTNYPADKDLWWRVQAVDWNDIHQSWSPQNTFRKTLLAPKPINNAASSELIPTWSWEPVDGAAGYDFEVDAPDGTTKAFHGWRSSAVTFVKLDGTGVWHWRVRALFPTLSVTQPVSGPWSDRQPFTNKMSAPSGATTASQGHGMLFTWDPKVGASRYQVEVSARADFGGALVERVSVDNPHFAPLLTMLGYQNGGTLYWRVAAVDENRNVGETTAPLLFNLPPRLRVQASGFLQKGKAGKLQVTVTDSAQKAMKGATVRLSGAGVSRTLRTGASGKIVVNVRPRRTGDITVTVTRSGYQPATSTLKVR
jgi:hypothetical protein